MLRRFKNALLTLLLAAVATAAAAEDYPSKPIRIVVSYPPASGPDLIARALGDSLSKSLGQPIVVDNKPGAAGVVGAGFVARAPADGYTLLVGDTSLLVLAPFLIKNLPYEPLKAFKPVALVAKIPYVFAASTKSSNIKSLQDLVREAKANPGKISYGSPGFGSNHHIIMEAFATEHGIQLLHVPYTGGAALNNALMAGQVQVALTSFGALGGNATSPAIKVLGVTTPTRFPSFPDVPSVSESLPGFVFTSEPGIVAPAGTAPEVVQKLTTAIKAAMETPAMQERFRGMYMLPSYGTPEQYSENLKADVVRFEKAVKNAKVEPQ